MILSGTYPGMENIVFREYKDGKWKTTIRVILIYFYLR